MNDKKQRYNVTATQKRPEFIKTMYYYNLSEKQLKKLLKKKNK